MNLILDLKVYNETEGMGTVVDYITSIANTLDNNTALFVVGDHGYFHLNLQIEIQEQQRMPNMYPLWCTSRILLFQRRKPKLQF